MSSGAVNALCPGVSTCDDDVLHPPVFRLAAAVLRDLSTDRVRNPHPRYSSGTARSAPPTTFVLNYRIAFFTPATFSL